MDGLLAAVGLKGVPYTRSRRDDDYVDRLSHRTTVAILVVFSFLVSAKQFVGDPINCWAPAHFEGSHEDYTNSYCWIRNTYYITPDDDVPAEEEGDKRSVLPYYQWIPMILLLQAMMFYAPYAMWVTLSGRSGIDIHSIVEAGQSFTVTEMTEIRDKTLAYMTMMMDRYLRCHSIEDDSSQCTVSIKNCMTRTCCRVCGRRRGNYLVVLYLIVKLLYLANVAGQLFMLDAFLGSSFHSYGFDVLRGAIEIGRDWPTVSSARFPRVTMCDLKVRRLGNIHRYTVQCVLPINLFNEKIFLFVYFWLIVVGVCTLFSLFMWIFRFASAGNRQRYVKRHLDFLGKLSKDSDRRKLAPKFVRLYLCQDGIFILRMIAHNTNTVTVTEFVSALWENFRKKPMVEKGNEDAADV